MKSYDIPHKGNEYYYSGMRSTLAGFIWSLMGVIIYSVASDLSFKKYAVMESWGVLVLMLLFIFFIGWSTNRFKNTLFVWSKTRKPQYNRKKAERWYTFLQLSTGVFCAFFFDCMFKEITKELIITTFIFWFFFVMGMNGFTNNAVEITETRVKEKLRETA